VVGGVGGAKEEKREGGGGGGKGKKKQNGEKRECATKREGNDKRTWGVDMSRVMEREKGKAK